MNFSKNKNQKARKSDNEVDDLESPPNSLFKEALLFLWEIVKVIIISLAIIIPIRYFLIQPFYVKGASMELNFHDHEYLIVDQISYRFHDVQRGDVVVFRYPKDPREFFIKRVIGLPGETVVIRNNKIFIYNSQNTDGEAVQESYLPKDIENIGNVTQKIEKDEYFLMGDNRPESLDSRVFGPVNRKHIVGRVFFRGWPLDKIQLYLENPKYGL